MNEEVVATGYDEHRQNFRQLHHVRLEAVDDGAAQGSDLSSEHTAAGVLAALRALCAERFGSTDLSTRSFAVLGRVGSHVLRMLADAHATRPDHPAHGADTALRRDRRPGGIIYATAVELHHETYTQAGVRVHRIADTLTGILRTARSAGSTPADTARFQARQRIRSGRFDRTG
ncbi:MAG TPA: hypothetical protein VF657_09160 [Actinoplanes sp.]